MNISFFGGLAQLGEHLPYKLKVTGSTPGSSIDADMAELSDAQDLGSWVFMAWRFESSYPHWKGVT